MKKTLRNLVIGAVMAATVLTVSSAAFAGQFVQTDMNFRNGAGTTAAIIGSVPAGAEVEVLGSTNGWDLIRYNGTTGYIHGGNLGSSFVARKQTKPAAPAATIAPAAQVSKSTQEYFDNNWSSTAKKLDQNTGAWKTVYVTSGYLALRNFPTYDSANEIGQLNTGDRVQIVGAISGSYITVYSPKHGTTGWVNAGFLG